MSRTDVQLMLDVKGGDEQSFELLLQRYRTPVVNFLFRMVKSREQAEDLAQEVFIRVYRAREEYVPTAKFTTWLFRIATNLALNSDINLKGTRGLVIRCKGAQWHAQPGGKEVADVVGVGSGQV